MNGIFNRNNYTYVFKHLIAAVIFVLGIELLKHVCNFIEPESNRIKDEFISNYIFFFWSDYFVTNNRRDGF